MSDTMTWDSVVFDLRINPDNPSDPPRPHVPSSVDESFADFEARAKASARKVRGHRGRARRRT